MSLSSTGLKQVFPTNKLPCALWAGGEDLPGLHRVGIVAEFEEGYFIVGFSNPKNPDEAMFVRAEPSDLTRLGDFMDAATAFGL